MICPFCKAPSGEPTSLTNPNHAPSPGDISICSYCTHVRIYDAGPDGLFLRKPTLDEDIEFAQHYETRMSIRAAKDALRAAKQSHKN